MVIAVCIDEKKGLQFNRRRQSRDRAQQEDLLALCGGQPLRIAPASAALFDWAGERVTAAEGFLEKATPGEICFVEENVPVSVEGRIEAVILYHWNRAYPADTWLKLDLSAFRLIERVEFTGKSHDTITRERYERSV